MWRKEHLWNVCVLQTGHLSILVKLFNDTVSSTVSSKMKNNE
jgi:hypothetical protein